MKQKKWKNCPLCGFKNSMRYRTNVSVDVKVRGYPSIKKNKIKGYHCKKCKETILTIAEVNRIDRLIGQHKAKIDSERLVAAELTTVRGAQLHLKLSKQRIHQLMDEGKLDYVFIEDKKIPVKNAVLNL